MTISYCDATHIKIVLGIRIHLLCHHHRSSIHDSEKKIDQSTIILDENTQKTIDSIKNIAINIREASNKARETMRVLRQSGAINELTSAIQEAMIAARDTTREINETAKELRDRGVIRDTASTIDETTTARA